LASSLPRRVLEIAKAENLFRQQEDRSTRYEPLLMELFPPECRPQQQEVLIEIYRKEKIAEAFRAFKKIYLEIVEEVIDHLKS
jgi:hypothetical protein